MTAPYIFPFKTLSPSLANTIQVTTTSKYNHYVFTHDLPLPLTPPGVTKSDGNRFFSPLLCNEKNLLASCLNGISFSCSPGSEPGAL